VLWAATELLLIVVGVVVVLGVIRIFSNNGVHPRARVFYDIGQSLIYFMK
jgi:hypothetical protein